jgi:hypothetical protein
MLSCDARGWDCDIAVTALSANRGATHVPAPDWDARSEAATELQPLPASRIRPMRGRTSVRTRVRTVVVVLRLSLAAACEVRGFFAAKALRVAVQVVTRQ